MAIIYLNADGRVGMKARGAIRRTSAVPAIAVLVPTSAVVSGTDVTSRLLPPKAPAGGRGSNGGPQNGAGRARCGPRRFAGPSRKIGPRREPDAPAAARAGLSRWTVNLSDHE